MEVLSRSRDEDPHRLEALEREEGVLPGERRSVTHVLSFAFNWDGAQGAQLELHVAGFDEVIPFDDGDEDDVHVTASRLQPMTAAMTARTRDELEDVARRHDGEYDGWDLTRTGWDVPLPPEHGAVRPLPPGWVRETLVARAKAAGDPVVACAGCRRETVEKLLDGERWRYWSIGRDGLRPFCPDCLPRRPLRSRVPE